MDDLPPERTINALKDLRRLNSHFGGYRVMRTLLENAAPPNSPFTVLDIGAASGDMSEVIRAAYPQATVFSLDYRPHHLRNAAPPKLIGDAFRLPVRQVDYVTCSLFLHHFTDAQIVELLKGFRAVAKRAVLVNDLERNFLAEAFVPATRWIFKWDSVVVHDAPISVAAGFKARELLALAQQAGLTGAKVWTFHPAFRLGLLGV
jgi:2-polyprenyl-3-methyl-5-hydroxy-6-metoxy-1,4-benzoquinol methylase